MEYKIIVFDHNGPQPVSLLLGDRFYNGFNTEQEAKDFIEREEWQLILPNSRRVEKRDARELFIMLRWR